MWKHETSIILFTGQHLETKDNLMGKCLLPLLSVSWFILHKSPSAFAADLSLMWKKVTASLTMLHWYCGYSLDKCLQLIIFKGACSVIILTQMNF